MASHVTGNFPLHEAAIAGHIGSDDTFVVVVIIIIIIIITSPSSEPSLVYDNHSQTLRCAAI